MTLCQGWLVIGYLGLTMQMVHHDQTMEHFQHYEGRKKLKYIDSMLIQLDSAWLLKATIATRLFVCEGIEKI